MLYLGKTNNNNDLPTKYYVDNLISTHTHSYAGSSSVGGSATSAEKLNNGTGAQSSFIENGRFSEWSSTYPDGCEIWTLGGISKVTVSGRNIVQFSCPTSGNQYGMILNSSFFSTNIDLEGNQYFALECKFRLTSGTSASGAALLINIYKTDASYDRFILSMSLAGTTLTTNTWYNVRKIFKLPDDSVQKTFSYISGHLLANWGADGDAVKTIQFSSVNMYEASEAEYCAQLWQSSSDKTKIDVSNISGTIPSSVSDGSITYSKLDSSVKYSLIPMVIGTQTSATASFTGVLNTISELYDGLTINYWLPYNPVGNPTLNLTLSDASTTGAINIYWNGTTRLSSHYTAGSVINMTYRVNANINGTSYTGWWTSADYDSDSNTYSRYFSNILAHTSITAGKIIVGTSSGYDNLSAGVGFDISYPILYAGATLSTGSTGNINYISMHNVQISTTYSFTATAYSMVYIKGTISGNIFTPATQVLTCTIPTSEDGYVYMSLGSVISLTAGSAAYIRLEPYHSLFKYTDTAFNPYSAGGSGGGLSSIVTNTGVGDGFTVNNTSTGRGIYLNNTSSGIGLQINSTSAGSKGLYINGVASTSSTTGSLVVSGGIGVSGDAYLGGSIVASNINKMVKTVSVTVATSSITITSTDIGEIFSYKYLEYFIYTPATTAGWIYCVINGMPSGYFSICQNTVSTSSFIIGNKGVAKGITSGSFTAVDSSFINKGTTASQDSGGSSYSHAGIITGAASYISQLVISSSSNFPVGTKIYIFASKNL